MKNYRITVNGTAYDVAVEEVGAGAAPAAAPVAAPAPAAAPSAPAAPAAASAPGQSADWWYTGRGPGAPGAWAVPAPEPG